jgi:C-terminal processing protease CtpA/Prc
VQYGLAVAALVSKINDSHGAVRTPGLLAFFGRVPPGVKVRYIEGKAVVTEVSTDSAVRGAGIKVGDVVTHVDGERIDARRARLTPYIAHSTPQALDNTMAQRILLGPDSSTAVLGLVGSDGREREVRLPRRLAFYQEMRWTRPGPTWKVLPGNIGYVDLERLTVPQVDSMFDALKDTKAIIFDNRSYPQGTAWSIAPRLTDRDDVVGARFQRPLVMSPDTTAWDTHAFVQTLPRTTKPRYHGKTVMLVDERTISQAEHTGLFFEAANGTKFVGSPTMGANGDVTTVVLPGGGMANFTGHDVRHADGRQLQRVGLQPQVLVRPTIAGIRAGKDEVLERAVRFIETGR